jgi:hypothetical protein
MSIDIQMNRNGSGRITMEYRISNMAESIGRLDGNEQWPVIPTGRADWQRTVDRIDGLRLVSFSTRNTELDAIYNVVLEFNNTQALLRSIDPTGTRTSFTDQNGQRQINILLNEPASAEYDTNLLDMARVMFAGYNFSISFRADNPCTLTVTDGRGNTLSSLPRAEIVSSGRRVFMSMNTMDLVTHPDGIGVRLNY